MKLTAYEFTHNNLRPGWARSVELDKQYGAVEALRLGTLRMLEAARHGVSLNQDTIASLPYVLAGRVLRSIPDPFDWTAFTSHPEMQAFLRLEQEIGTMAMRQDLVDDWSSALARHLWHYTLHELGGQKVYELSLPLAAKLQHTELRGLTTDDLRLPFKNIYIVVPDGAGATIDNQISGRHDLGGVYITEAENEGERFWMLLFWAPPNQNASSEHDDAIFHFTVQLPKGLELSEALNLNEKNTRGRAATTHAEDFYQSNWRKLFELVMNTVVYATWPDAELRQTENPRYTKLMERVKKHPKGSHKREVASAELREVLPQRRIVLGSSVKDLGQTGTGTPHGPLTVRTLVSGHWKRQFYGEGRALRKWIFIEPFWRGPDEGPESNPRRVLEGN